MPIRIKGATDSRIGRVSAKLGALTAAIRGTMTPPPGRTGRILSALGALTVALHGQASAPAVSRNGKIVANLGSLSSALRGTFTPAGTLPVGTLALDGLPTPEQIALVLPVTGSLPTSATATVRYWITSIGTPQIGHPLLRVRPAFALTDGPTVQDCFAWAIIDLQPGVSYTVEVTVTSGAVVQVLPTQAFTTRSLPAASGTTTVSIAAGSTAAQIQTAINTAAAGAVVELADGTYNLSALISLNNTNAPANNPIFVRGQSRDGVRLSRASVMQLQAVNNVVFERMTLVGSGVDSGTNASSVAANFFNGSPRQTNVTFRNMTFSGFDQGIIAQAGTDGLLVYDCNLLGNNQWNQDFYVNGGGGAPGAGDGTKDATQNIFWNDDGVCISGRGNFAFNNTLKGFGDNFTLSAGTQSAGSGAFITQGAFCARNDCSIGDDFFEADYGFRNVHVYDNRVRNTCTMVSSDPLYGGPLSFSRNIGINIGRAPYKMNSTSTGWFIYNNTVIRTEGFNSGLSWGWNQSGDSGNNVQRAIGYANNILIYRGAGNLMAMEAVTMDPIDFDHNAWFSAGGQAVWWSNVAGGGSFASMAAARTALPAIAPMFSGLTKRHTGDVMTTSNPFNETITLGADWSTEITTAITPTPLAGSALIGAGRAISNITDGYSGSGPDIGAIMTGRAIPTYGDRTSTSSATYVTSMTAYQVAALSGALAPSNGTTTIQSVTPAEWLGGGPSPQTGFDAIIKAYSGGGKALSGYKLFVHGGGHNDSANNGLYVFDVSGTTKPTGWQTPLVISPVASVNSSESAYGDGKPPAIHTDDNMCTLGDFVYRFNGNTWPSGNAPNPSFFAWRYQISTKTWSVLAAHSALGTQRCGTIADETTKKILVFFENQTDGYFYRTPECATNPNSWSGAVPMGQYFQDYNMGIRGPGNECLLLGSTGTQPAGKRKLTVDFANETISSASFSTTGSSALFSNNAYSAAFDTQRWVYWMWGGGSGSAGWSNFYELDLTTGVVTAHALSQTIPQVSGLGFSEGRFLANFTDRFIATVNQTDGPVYIVRLPDSYTTLFATTENPISESGKWVDGKAVGGSWNNPLVTGGHGVAAVNSGLGASRYDDSIAHLSTSVFAAGANQFAQGTVYKAGGYSGNGGGHEIELLLRFSITNGNARGYEVMWGVPGYLAIVRWNGALGSYSQGSVNANGQYAVGTFPVPQDGDVLRAEINGNILKVYRNGTQVASIDVSSDFGGGTVWSSGQPGMGFWPVDGAIAGNYGWKRWTGGNL